jgi:hypothetical protein
MKEDSLLIVAYHEAGHAIAKKVLGLKLRLVTIVPDEDYSGIVKGAIGINVDRLQYDVFTVNEVARWHNRIIALLAGAEAQKKFKPHSLRTHMVAADNANIQTILENIHPSNECRAVMNWLRIRTQNLINNPKNWRYIEDVAAVLVKKRTLTGAEMSEVIAASFKRLMGERRRRPF